MLRRSLRTRERVGAAARRRIQSGGPRATGRPAASLEEWAAIRRLVFRRARWRCQACGRRGALEVHHVVKRAQGGSDFDLDRLVALCPRCHAQTDAPYVRGRLVVTPLGDGRFTIETVPGVDKWVIRALATAEEGECSGSPRRRKDAAGGQTQPSPSEQPGMSS
jgi:HNH endonuclease